MMTSSLGSDDLSVTVALPQFSVSEQLTPTSPKIVNNGVNDGTDSGEGSSVMPSRPPTQALVTSNGKRITMLTFDPSKPRPVAAIPKEEVKMDIQDQQNWKFPDFEKVEESQFVCAVCDAEFYTYISLESHLAVHALHNEQIKIENDGEIMDDKKLFKCPVCRRKFYSKVTMNNHRRSHNWKKDVYLGCSLCDRTFTYGINLYRHLMSAHQEDKINAASHCAKALKGAKCYENKLVTYTGEKLKPYQCSLCSKTFKRLYRAREHSRGHSGLKPFQCSVCRKVFSSSETLSKHIKTLHNDIPQALSPEKNALQLDDTLATHQAPAPPTIHFMDSPRTTTVQMQQDTYEINFLSISRHTDTIDVSTSEETACSNSDLSMNTVRADFPSQFEEQEVFDSSTQKAFRCSLCGEMFFSSSLLNKHISTHKFKLQAKCSICQKEFKNEAYMRRHMVIHLAEKPYKCSFCPKAYYRPYCLSNHLRSHTGEKPYQCSVCRKSFAIIENMYKHIKKVHKGEGLQTASIAVKQIQEMNRERLRTFKANLTTSNNVVTVNSKWDVVSSVTN